MIGVTCGTLRGVCIVIECFARNAVVSVLVGAALGVEEIWGFEALEGLGEPSAGVGLFSVAFSIFLLFFFSFFSFLNSEVLGVSTTLAMVVSSCSSRLRFFFFSFLSSVEGMESANHRSILLLPFHSLELTFLID